MENRFRFLSFGIFRFLFIVTFYCFVNNLMCSVGTGYHLVIVKDKSCDVPRLTSVIKSFIPTAELKSAISAELSYLLPFDEASKFEGLFMEIESKKDELGVSSFGTTATTMEEVFIRYTFYEHYKFNAVMSIMEKFSSLNGITVQMCRKRNIKLTNWCL